MSLQSLISTGTKLWLDSIEPELVRKNRAMGATGATSNPIIISDIIKGGRFDEKIAALIGKGMDDSAIAWELTDQLVRGPWLLGDRFTAADVLWGTALTWTTGFKLVPLVPPIQAYLERWNARPSVSRVKAKDAELAAAQG